MGKKAFGIDIKECMFVGKGKEGSVYLTPDGNVLKIYKNMDRCKSEYKILKKMESMQYFPKVMACNGRCMLREYIEGTSVVEYIQEKGLSRTLALNLIKFAEDFEQMKIRLDGLSKHVFIQEDESIKVVDPRKKDCRMYKYLLNTLKRTGKLDEFLNVLKDEKPDLLLRWHEAVSKIIK
ncbi:serine/threonine protein kinase [Clostridiaceae bacterium 35-E11]